MAITKLSDSSITTGDKYISMLAGNPYYVPPSFESIASQTVGVGGASSIIFNSIPSTYQHLQLRVCNIGSSAANAYVRVNTDTNANNYPSHFLRSDGANASATGYAGGSYGDGFPLFEGTVTTYPTVSILNIHDYSSTTKNKTAIAFAGKDNNSTGGVVWLTSGAWLSTSAINRLDIVTGSGSFGSTSTFSLYGIKGA